MEAFNNGGQVPAYGNEKSPRQLIEELREQLQTEKERNYILDKERQELRSWKAQALACTPDWQAIGKALNLKLGTSVSDQVLPGILNLLKDRHELVIQLRRQQAYCTRYVRAYQSTARYREVEDLLDKHHHSTETI